MIECNFYFGGESHSGKKIPWSEGAVWVRVPPSLQKNLQNKNFIYIFAKN